MFVALNCGHGHDQAHDHGPSGQNSNNQFHRSFPGPPAIARLTFTQYRENGGRPQLHDLYWGWAIRATNGANPAFIGNERARRDTVSELGKTPI
jgi:hypothetical protein